MRGLHAQLRGLQGPREPTGPSPPELMKEISRLNRQLEDKMHDCASMRQELAATLRARDGALERVQMLEQQVATPLVLGSCEAASACRLSGGRSGPGRKALYGALSFLKQKLCGTLTPGLLSLQILAYKDDFTSERADRERAQGRIQELEEKVAALQHQAPCGQVPYECFFLL